MRFLRLAAHAFGLFRDRTFEFAPGFNIVHGPNETGKSTLHAAMHVGLCGVRRGPGRTRDEEALERFRPWQGEGWKVSALVQLGDGSRVELGQDLEDRARCRAMDADLHRDRSAEIRNEGTPDASLWLGLDRRTYLATACVRQAELVAMREDPAALQAHLQRAVATSGADGTAAEALRRLETFQREHVGGRQANSTKPLRVALDAVEEAGRGLRAAQGAHAAYLELLGEREERARAVASVRTELRLAEAALAAARAAGHRRDIQRVRELAARHAGGPPAGLAADADLAAAVRRALDAMEARRTVPGLQGSSAAEMRAELAESARSIDEQERRLRLLPPAAGSPVPVGPGGAAATLPAGAPADGLRRETTPGHGAPHEDAPAPELLAAADALRRVDAHLEEHRSQRPAEPDRTPALGAGMEDMLRLAEVLARPEPEVDATLLAQHRALERQLAEARHSPRRGTLLGAATTVLVAACAVCMVAGILGPHRVLGLGFALLAGAAVALALLRRGATASQVAILEELRAVEARLAAARSRHDDWIEERAGAERAARALGIDPEPEALRGAAAARQARDHEAARRLAWERRDGELHREFEDRRTALRDLLAARGVCAGEDVFGDLEAYRSLCDFRSKHRSLAARCEERAQLEAEVVAVQEQCARAEAAVRDAARRCGIAGDDLDACRIALETWWDDRRASLDRHEHALQEWSELQHLLAGRTLAEAEVDLQALEEEANRAASGVDEAVLARIPADAAERDRRAAALRAAELELARVEEQVRQSVRTAPSVAEAEEELRSREAELAHIQDLEETLATARRFLQRAEEQVHRDVAPRLADWVRSALPAVTSGRYDDVRVDPASLHVAVHEKDGAWRDAAVLSHGTEEQVYLLFRVALAQLLTRPGEVCPLLLDDPTVQFDPERKRAVLETLHALSRERQIVFLTQEQDVVAWAREHLAAPHDALIALSPVAVA
jgi:hypothetical protein